MTLWCPCTSSRSFNLPGSLSIVTTTTARNSSSSCSDSAKDEDEHPKYWPGLDISWKSPTHWHAPPPTGEEDEEEVQGIIAIGGHLPDWLTELRASEEPFVREKRLQDSAQNGGDLHFALCHEVNNTFSQLAVGGISGLVSSFDPDRYPLLPPPPTVCCVCLGFPALLIEWVCVCSVFLCVTEKMILEWSCNEGGDQV